MKEFKTYPIKTGFLSLLVIPLLILSCNKDLIEYKGREGVYFAVQYGPWDGSESSWPYYNYSNIPFTKVAGADTTLRLKVMVTGRHYSYDRSFSVEINPDSTTAVLGTHFRPVTSSLIIPANSNYTYIPITLLRAPDLKTTVKKIGLRLIPSDQLKLSFPDWDAIPNLSYGTAPIVEKYDASLHTIIINDWVVKPLAWSGMVLPNKLEVGHWGEFSEEKLQLMCAVMDLTYMQFDSYESMPTPLVNLITREVASYLQEKFDAGEPVLEKDGRLMYISGVTWTSYVGTPWKK